MSSVPTRPVTDRLIAVELLRHQLQAIADESADTVERTAISPIVTEGQDYGSVVLDARGRLLAGGGVATLHWVGATRAVRATLARYRDSLAPGDVFLANDPHNGGGMHPADVMVQRPIFACDELVGWSVLSAHLMDMGGMAVGSWTPHATDCYQEALRIPPVRLISRGSEVAEIWDLFRTNIRFADLVEMDLRGLIAGSHVASNKLQPLVERIGATMFRERVDALIDATSRALRERIRQLEPGVYRTTSWTEWGDSFVTTPCALTVGDGRLSFDFTGSDPQIPFFINSKPYIILTLFAPLLAARVAPDLPYNEGLLEPIELICPEGSVVNSTPPAPGNCGHMHLGQTAAETMSQCLRLAMWASPDFQRPNGDGGYEGGSALAPNSYWATDTTGQLDAWMMLDGLMLGQSASPGRDGEDFTTRVFDLPGRPTSQPTPLDVEAYESWYPILLEERSLILGPYGAGQWRAGGSLQYRFAPRGTDRVGGQMLGYRGHLPLPGVGGGMPGATARFAIERAGGRADSIGMSSSDVVVNAGDTFWLRNASGGGWGDPLLRQPGAVLRDHLEGRLTRDECDAVYGVVVRDGEVDEEATADGRASVLIARLAAATPPAMPMNADSAATGGEPLYLGVLQRGSHALSEASGAVLADAPNHWTAGCPVLVQAEDDATVEVRSYLDPRTGYALATEVVPRGAAQSFSSLPTRWIVSARTGDSRQDTT